MSSSSISEKAVILVDPEIPLGFLANAVAVASFSLGQAIDPICGEEVRDADGNPYFGIIQIPLPILSAAPSRMLQIRELLRSGIFEKVVAVDFTAQAQRPQAYEAYNAVMAETKAEDMVHRTLALFGPKKLVDRLTGNLPLLR